MSRRSFSLSPCALVADAGSLSEVRNYSVRLGVDNHSLNHDSPPARVSQLFDILEQFGFKHVNIWLQPITEAGDQNSLRMAERIAQIDRHMRQHGMT